MNVQNLRKNAMHIPRISIGLPVYNGANYLRTALDSILQQDFTDFELIISDNASTDETALICQEYVNKDKRIRYFRKESNIGAAGNFNRVFTLARSRYFKWATHDDIHLPGFLRLCVDILDKAPPSVVLVSPRAEIINEDGKHIKEDWHIENLDTRRPRAYQRVADVLNNVDWATSQFGLIRSDALRKTQLIGRFEASDYVLLLELAVLGEIWEIPEVLFQRRYHSGISTIANKTQVDLLQWFDPSQKNKRLIFPRMEAAFKPRIKLGLEYVRSIMRMRLTPKERVFCLGTALSIWSLKETKRLWGVYWPHIKKIFVA